MGVGSLLCTARTIFKPLLRLVSLELRNLIENIIVETVRLVVLPINKLRVETTLQFIHLKKLHKRIHTNDFVSVLVFFLIRNAVLSHKIHRGKYKFRSNLTN